MEGVSFAISFSFFHANYLTKGRKRQCRRPHLCDHVVDPFLWHDHHRDFWTERMLLASSWLIDVDDERSQSDYNNVSNSLQHCLSIVSP